MNDRGVDGDGSRPRRRPVAIALQLGLLMSAAVAVVAAIVVFRDSAAPSAGASGFQGGPQGMVPQFVVRCAFSHSSNDDPIVLPDEPGMSHRHDFFGNRSTDASSTPDSLLGAETSCQQALDTAAYWSPTLFDGDEPVVPQGADVYYRPGPGIDPAEVVAYPHGLMMLSGDPGAVGDQSDRFVGWTCGSGGTPELQVPVCPADSPLRLEVVFPDCWNGADLDSEDHRSHMAASRGGECPKSHPVAVPQITLTIRYPVWGEGHDLELASGGMNSGHADFLNAWDEDELRSQVELCLNRGLICGVISNKAEDIDRPMPSRS